MPSKAELELCFREYLDRDGLHAMHDVARDAYIFLVECSVKVGTVVVEIHILDERIVSLARCAMRMDTNDSETMHRVSEYLQRATYGMSVGSFDLNFDEGEALFRTTLTCGSGLPCDDSLRMVIGMGPSMWAQYGDGFLEVAFEGADPKEVASSSDAGMSVLERALAGEFDEDGDHGDES